ncbi:acid protease [Russula emetica]|nr:acid protease [Russula emetica]
MLPSIIFVLALSLPFSLAAVPPRRDETFHVPLVRRRSNVRRQGSVDLDHYATVSNGLRAKYGYGSSSPSRRAQTTDIGITNQGSDTSYFAQVSVGTPAQKLNLVLDTGSSDLWFATTGCAGCSSSTPVLDPSKSSSIQLETQRIPLNYGSGSAEGVLAHDTVTMGPFTVNPQTFVGVDDVSSGLIDGELAGIMGLAFQGIANSQALPFWQALVNNNQLTNPEFSVFITRFVNDANAKTEEPGGVLTFGGTNSTLYQGNIDFQNFTLSGSGSFWLQTVSAATVNGNSVSIGSGNTAAIDTGTTLIGAPTAAVNAIWGAVSGSVPLSGNMSGFYSFPCDAQLNIAMSFGGPAWPISIADLNLGTVSDGNCLGAIFDITAGSNVKPTPGTPQWIVGDTFLKNVYTVFRSNPPSVGFAQLSSAAGGSSGSQRFISHSAIIYTLVGMRVMGYSYVPLHVFLPVADPRHH